jgi:hypothetical protein
MDQEKICLAYDARNCGSRLKTLKGLTPYEAICKGADSHQMPGLSISHFRHFKARPATSVTVTMHGEKA